MLDDPWTPGTALTDREDSPMGVAVDGGDVYFTTGGSMVGENAVRLVPLDGSAPSRIVSTKSEDFVPGEPIVAAGGAVYAESGGAIYRIDPASGTTEVLVPERPGSVVALAVTDDALWWSTSQLNIPSATEVARLPLAGGAIEILATGIETKDRPYLTDVEERRARTVPGMTSASDIAVDADGALVTCTEGLLRVAAGVAPRVVVPTDTPAAAVAIDGDTAYFLVVGKRESLRSVPRSGGAITELHADLSDSGLIVVTAGSVIGVDLGGLGSGDGRIVAVPVAGGAGRTLSQGPFVGSSLAVAGTDIVFLGNSRVWKVPV